MARFSIHERIDDLDAAQWNALAGQDAPHLRHEFLAAMEHHDCVGERFGWIPQHLALHDDQGQLIAAAPCYLKFNSYGEFVFDWAWADAYQRAGYRYFPKLVIASPYTPATAGRILTGDAPERSALAQALIQGARAHAERLRVSGLHWLFTSEEENHWLQREEHMPRLGCQFHWTNRSYRDFDDLLERFTAEKRKKVKRERRRVIEAGVQLRRVPGHAVTEAEWALFHQLYEDTFDKRGGIPTLTLPFFQEIAERMGDQLLLVFAEHGGASPQKLQSRQDQYQADPQPDAINPPQADTNRIVAAAFCLQGENSLYGRHWGCRQDFHSLHFEACYYQGLDHCISKGLERFEPGAQGEHKIPRGFLPTRTWSAHWIARPEFRIPIGNFLSHEIEAMEDYIEEMQERSPYKAGEDPRLDPIPEQHALSAGAG